MKFYEYCEQHDLHLSFELSEACAYLEAVGFIFQVTYDLEDAEEKADKVFRQRMTGEIKSEEQA